MVNSSLVDEVEPQTIHHWTRIIQGVQRRKGTGTRGIHHAPITSLKNEVTERLSLVVFVTFLIAV